MSRFFRSPLSAVLGPTNTGKTHLAVERMLGHNSGMMGFPLRLLAREVYDRVVKARGAHAAALVTGEERIWPETARYMLCTAEAMPLLATAQDGQAGIADARARDVAFVALDEAQIGQDRERGHVFTSRLMYARGREETMILGSGALAPVVRSLLPDAEIIGRPRFSTLSYAGPKKLSRLPPRSVIVAFSAEEVYTIAEALRRFSGGAAVVMGALSPRTRNAQVDMFQAGEVDYLVATDAIGMGLNLDVGHVAFASLNKFDGTRQRRLTIPEMAQIAGRAGRHQRDGTFGSIGSEAAFADEEVEAITEHRFPPIDWLHWRNPSPDMDSVAALIAGLEAPPPDAALRPAPEATDLAVLRRMQGDAEAMELVSGSASVRRLWSASSLPDFTKAGPEAHGRMVARLWRDLGTGNGHIDADWFAGQLAQLDSIEGTIEAIADRIAKVRSYCYIAHRPDWLAEPAVMAEAAQAVETRLSDALHNALTARFVDRRTTVLLRSLGQGAATLPVVVDADGAVKVDGETIGHLEGFAFKVDPAASAGDRKMLLAAAQRHLAVELAGRASALAATEDAALELVLDDVPLPELRWQGRKVATLERGRTRLAPRVVLDRTIAILDGPIVAAVIDRLKTFVDRHIGDHLRPLVSIAAKARDPQVTPPVRAVLAAMADRGGSVARADVDNSMGAMSPEDRTELRKQGIKVGSLDLFHVQLLKPGALRWAAALEGAWRGVAVPPLPVPGINLLPATSDVPPVVSGFRRVGDFWLRVDLVERVALHLHNTRRGLVEPRPVAPEVVEPADTLAPMVELVGEGDMEHASAPELSVLASVDTPLEILPDGQFRIDPELARSIGFPLADRIKLYRMLGFRTVVPQREVTIEEEASLLWTWRGREKQGQHGGRSGGQRRPEGLRFEHRRDDAEPHRKRSHPHHGKGKSTGGKADSRSKPRYQRDDTPAARSAAPEPVNNPFGALADLLGSDGPKKGKPR